MVSAIRNMPFEIALCLTDANSPSYLCERLAANSLVSQDLPDGAMADACIALKCANSSLENLLFDIFARNPFQVHPELVSAHRP